MAAKDTEEEEEEEEEGEGEALPKAATKEDSILDENKVFIEDVFDDNSLDDFQMKTDEETIFAESVQTKAKESLCFMGDSEAKADVEMKAKEPPKTSEEVGTKAKENSTSEAKDTFVKNVKMKAKDLSKKESLTSVKAEVTKATGARPKAILPKAKAKPKAVKDIFIEERSLSERLLISVPRPKNYSPPIVLIHDCDPQLLQSELTDDEMDLMLARLTSLGVSPK